MISAIFKLINRNKTPQEELNCLPWEKKPTREMKINLILGVIKPRRRKFEVQREDSYYYNLVGFYSISKRFSQSDTVNGTFAYPGAVFKPISEKHRKATEESVSNLKDTVLADLGLNLDHLVAAKNS